MRIIRYFRFLKTQNETDNFPRDFNDFKNLFYSLRFESIFESRYDLISLTTPQWMEIILSNHGASRSVTALEIRTRQNYQILDYDADFLTLEAESDKKVFKLIIPPTKGLSKGIFVHCQLVKFGNNWELNGVLMRDKIDMFTPIDSSHFIEVFKKANGGKVYRFFDSNDELNHFIFNDMGMESDKPIDFPECGSKGFITMLLSKTMMNMSQNIECICCPENKHYNKEKAKKNALVFIMDESIDYEFSCLLQELNMIPDAAINSVQGYEYGRDFIRKHHIFFTDYFHHRCHAIDL